ncbi:Hydroxyproline-rich glycoprotein family protein, putative isoform 2 [Quillaja saponaria]|uniref:Hydroxyproline-rich glycoprotein family protein, putative isoform 2 n=1 Tax=Quillaja saponaria TaxID=32244 RepID=A0AAD7LIQ7_QUISA|nr:Hydroxyproline-rich glycoprotein family protein, putative isoform 2 [Quillaja saponaria]
MEESEKRRERLKAMSMQADLADVSGSNEGSAVPGCLSNPLIETSATMPLRGESGATPRFDFYTDPMSAFSASKKRGNVSNQITPNCFSPLNFCGFPMPQFTSPYPESVNSLMTPPSQLYQVPNRMEPGTYPGVQLAIMVNIILQVGVVPQVLDMNHQRSSPSPSPGRGRGGRYNNGRGPGFGWSGRRGQGSCGRQSPVDRIHVPKQFYRKSMVEDPWKFMKPVMWKRINAPSNTPESSKSLSSKSFGTKKAKVSDASDRSSSQPSLAEYLAASFNEAVNDASNG